MPPDPIMQPPGDDQPADEDTPLWPEDWDPTAWQRERDRTAAWDALSEEQQTAARSIGEGPLEVSVDLVAEALEHFGEELQPITLSSAQQLGKQVHSDARYSPELRESVEVLLEEAEAFPDNTRQLRMLSLLKGRVDTALETAMAKAGPSGGTHTYVKQIDGFKYVVTYDLDTKGRERELLTSQPLEEVQQQIAEEGNPETRFGDLADLSPETVAKWPESRRRALLEAHPDKFAELMR
jgi:hypothetical protein